MAMSTCMKCGGHFFEMVEREPRNANVKVNFIQCTSCGGVVGVMDYWPVGKVVKQIQEKLGIR